MTNGPIFQDLTVSAGRVVFNFLRNGSNYDTESIRKTDMAQLAVIYASEQLGIKKSAPAGGSIDGLETYITSEKLTFTLDVQSGIDVYGPSMADKLTKKVKEVFADKKLMELIGNKVDIIREKDDAYMNKDYKLVFEKQLEIEQMKFDEKSQGKKITQSELEELALMARNIGGELTINNVEGAKDKVEFKLNGKNYTYNVEFANDGIALKK